jgi:hypothetical protein
MPEDYEFASLDGPVRFSELVADDKGTLVLYSFSHKNRCRATLSRV